MCWTKFKYLFVFLGHFRRISNDNQCKWNAAGQWVDMVHVFPFNTLMSGSWNFTPRIILLNKTLNLMLAKQVENFLL